MILAKKMNARAMGGRRGLSSGRAMGPGGTPNVSRPKSRHGYAVPEEQNPSKRRKVAGVR